MAGNLENDLICYLRTKTTDKTLNLSFSESLAIEKQGCPLRSTSEMERRSQSTFPSLLRFKKISHLKMMVTVDKS